MYRLQVTCFKRGRDHQLPPFDDHQHEIMLSSHVSFLQDYLFSLSTQVSIYGWMAGMTMKLFAD